VRLYKVGSAIAVFAQFSDKKEAHEYAKRRSRRNGGRFTVYVQATEEVRVEAECGAYHLGKKQP